MIKPNCTIITVGYFNTRTYAGQKCLCRKKSLFRDLIVEHIQAPNLEDFQPRNALLPGKRSNSPPAHAMFFFISIRIFFMFHRDKLQRMLKYEKLLRDDLVGWNNL